MKVWEKWHFTKNLAMLTPDTNDRHIYRADKNMGTISIRESDNPETWAMEMDERLSRLCSNLNRLEGWE